MLTPQLVMFVSSPGDTDVDWVVQLVVVGLAKLEFSTVITAADAVPTARPIAADAASATAAREQPRETDERLENINDSFRSILELLGLSISRMDDGLPQHSAADVTILNLVLISYFLILATTLLSHSTPTARLAKMKLRTP